jgi:hypothetical protein
VLALIIAAGASATPVVLTIIGAVAGLISSMGAVLAVRANRKAADAAETTAEGSAIKAISEANEVTLRGLRGEVDRLAAVVTKLNDRLNQERQWIVRLIRALNTAGVEIPARPDNTMPAPTDEEDITGETLATVYGPKKRS